VLAAVVVCLPLLNCQLVQAAPRHGHGHHSGHHGRHTGGHHTGGHHYGGHHYGGYHGSYVFRDYGHYYPSYYSYAYPYGVTLGGPLFVEPRAVVGPQSLRRFLGVDGVLGRNGVLRLDGRQAVEAPPQPPRERPAEPRHAERGPRKSNAAARQRARRYVEFGDGRFVGQQFHEASQRYKKAISAAPDVATAYFRRGHAELALGQYARAAKSYKAGLRLKANWHETPFRFEDFYGDNVAARKAHLEALAEAAEKDAQNANLFFLIGVQLHFSEKPERAKLFFQQAARLSGGRVDHLAGFLPGVKRGKRDDVVAF
ncbi:MAG: tetratricopeptide repeat protein, partial [Planctomycetes bacterium]|nr:tetratricopeptide repeat protein [Planctomycetota bacterium]